MVRSHQYRNLTLPAWSPTQWYLAAFIVLAIVTAVGAQIMAFSWRKAPFPGFLVEKSLIVVDAYGQDWSGYQAGIRYPQRVVAVNGIPVRDDKSLNQILRQHGIGDRVQIQTISPDQEVRNFPDITLMSLPGVDFTRLFILPYLTGLVYLAIGAWVFWKRGESLAARAFVYLCITGSITIILLFDLTTTHFGTGLWTLTMAQQGGALFSLGMLFPEISGQVQRRSWLRFIPYAVSGVLVVWGLWSVYDLTRPWAYIIAWRASYIYASAGILFFWVYMLFRYRTTGSLIARQQIRIILLGALVSFAPLAIWLGAPLVGMEIRWNPAFFLPFLLIFPATLLLAIVRYRLWDVDTIINRTIVYSILSILLVVVYLTAILIFHNLIVVISGMQSEIDKVLATLSLLAVLNPLRDRVQAAVDKRFYRKKYDPARILSELSLAVRDVVDLDQITAILRLVLNDTLDPARSAIVLLDAPVKSEDLTEVPSDDELVIYFEKNAEPVLLENCPIVSEVSLQLNKLGHKVVVPIVSQGQVLGLLILGKRLSDQDYATDDLMLLNAMANQVAPAIKVAQLVRMREAEAMARQQIQHEMQVASVIQKTLLPKEPPTIPGLEIAVYYQPARAVGGDFYDFYQLPDNRLVLVVGDVTDKGVPAALLMATTKAILRGAARRMLAPSEALKHTNEILIPDMPANMFVTCLYAVLNTATGHLVFANAGHNLPCHHSGDNVCELVATGMPLGLMPDMVYDESETCLEPGDSLLLYSDGIVEAHNADRDMFGFPRLRELMRQKNHIGPVLIESLLAALKGFTGPEWEQEDDITLLAVHRSSNSQVG